MSCKLHPFYAYSVPDYCVLMYIDVVEWNCWLQLWIRERKVIDVHLGSLTEMCVNNLKHCIMGNISCNVLIIASCNVIN